MPGRPAEHTVEDAEFLFSWGLDPRQVAERLGLRINSIEVAYRRAGVEWPWVYVVPIKEYERKPRPRRRLLQHANGD